MGAEDTTGTGCETGEENIVNGENENGVIESNEADVKSNKGSCEMGPQLNNDAKMGKEQNSDASFVKQETVESTGVETTYTPQLNNHIQSDLTTAENAPKTKELISDAVDIETESEVAVNHDSVVIADCVIDAIIEAASSGENTPIKNIPDVVSCTEIKKDKNLVSIIETEDGQVSVNGKEGTIAQVKVEEDILASVKNKEDNIALVTGKEDNIALVTGKEDHSTRVNGKEDNSTSVKGKEDHSALVNKEEYNLTPVNGEEDNQVPVNGQEDNQALSNGNEDTSASINNKEDNLTQVNDKEDNSTPVNGKEDNQVPVNGKEYNQAPVNGIEDNQAPVSGEEDNKTPVNNGKEENQVLLKDISALVNAKEDNQAPVNSKEDNQASVNSKEDTSAQVNIKEDISAPINNKEDNSALTNDKDNCVLDLKEQDKTTEEETTKMADTNKNVTNEEGWVICDPENITDTLVSAIDEIDSAVNAEVSENNDTNKAIEDNAETLKDLIAKDDPLIASVESESSFEKIDQVNNVIDATNSEDTLITENAAKDIINDSHVVGLPPKPLQNNEKVVSPIAAKRRSKQNRQDSESEPSKRDSYQETKQEIQDSLSFIKSKISEPVNSAVEVSDKPSKVESSDVEMKEVSLRDSATPDYEPITVDDPDPVYESVQENTPSPQENIKSTKKIAPKKPDNVEIIEKTDLSKRQFAAECIPPLRPARSKRQEKMEVPTWKPPEENIMTYLCGCFTRRCK